MRVLVLSPYHGGSHKAWLEGLQRHSRHTVLSLTLPGQFWQWRMLGSAVTLARLYSERLGAGQQPPDVLLATGMLDLAKFLALTRASTAHIPAALYMHENQLTYPLPEEGTKGPMRRRMGARDRHYAFINYASMLAADRVLFNSRFHSESWFEALPRFLMHYPEHRELDQAAHLIDKSVVVYPGVAETVSALEGSPGDTTPLILWNHRLEWDKNPEQFLAAMITLAGEGWQFQVALGGERFGRPPDGVEEQIALLGNCVTHNDYANSSTYEALLRRAAIVVSTARHEFFGIGVLEAIGARTFPILPNRLSYPELLPPGTHDVCLYGSHDELLARLRRALDRPDESRQAAAELSRHVQQYAWPRAITAYDDLFAELAA